MFVLIALFVQLIDIWQACQKRDLLFWITQMSVCIVLCTVAKSENFQLRWEMFDWTNHVQLCYTFDGRLLWLGDYRFGKKHTGKIRGLPFHSLLELLRTVCGVTKITVSTTVNAVRACTALFDTNSDNKFVLCPYSRTASVSTEPLQGLLNNWLPCTVCVLFLLIFILFFYEPLRHHFLFLTYVLGFLFTTSVSSMPDCWY